MPDTSKLERAARAQILREPRGLDSLVSLAYSYNRIGLLNPHASHQATAAIPELVDATAVYAWDPKAPTYRQLGYKARSDVDVLAKHWPG